MVRIRFFAGSFDRVPSVKVAGAWGGGPFDRMQPHIASTLDHPTIGPACGWCNNNEPAPHDTLRTHPDCFVWFRTVHNARQRRSCHRTSDACTAFLGFRVKHSDQVCRGMQTEDLGECAFDV